MSAETEIILAGDSLIQHRLSPYQDPGFLRLVELIRGADVAVTNLECNLQAGEDPPAYAAGGGRGATYMAAPPFCAEELRWLGYRAVWTANNHSADFGEGGILTTLHHLDAAGLAHAGTGPTLAAATAPAYIETPKGRVALLGASDFGARGRADLPYPWAMGFLAADPDAFFKGRPGMNLVRYEPVTHVDRETLDALRRASQKLGWEEAKAMRNVGGGRADPLIGTTVFNAERDTETEFHFMGRKFVQDDTFTFETVPYEEDLERNRKWIREARRQADFVVVGYHQQGAARSEDEPVDHTRIFAHAAIDAGADVFAAHGRGRAGGVEIYKGKPIIYGLPGFVTQLDQVRHVPREQKARWGVAIEGTAADFLETREAAEATRGTEIGAHGFRPMVMYSAVFDAERRFKEVRLYPIEMSRSESRSQRGKPHLLDPAGETARQTLNVMADRTAPLGTKLAVRDGVGVIGRPA
jgi:poly-gamma-glutamate synthesis protein (capsule biosynthesis protein)